MEGIMRKIWIWAFLIVINFLFFNFVKAENILDVPFITQLPPGTSWHDTKNCGPTSYLMVDSFYTDKNLSVQSIKEIDDWLNKNYGRPIDNYNGYYTSINDLKKIGLEFGNFLDNDIEIVNSLEKIKDALKNDLPIIIFVYTNMRYKVERDQPHFMVLTGIEGDTVYTNDPGKTNGKNKAYPLQQFLYAWSLQNNAAIIFYPPGHNSQKLNTNNNFFDFSSIFSDFFDFGKNIFDLQNIIPSEQNVKGETVVAQQEESETVVYTASITDRNQTLEVEPNQVVDIVVKAKNTGNTTWQKNLISLNAVGGEAIVQQFYDSSWKTHLRPTLVDNDTKSGEIGTFSFKIKSPEEIGAYKFKAIVVRQNGLQFNNVGNDVFVLNLNVREKEVVIPPVVPVEENKINVLDKVKQTVDDVINKVNDVVENIIKNIPTFFGGGSSGSNHATEQNNNNSNLENNIPEPEPELFFTVSSSVSSTNLVTTTIFGEKSTALIDLQINNVSSTFFVSDTAWSTNINLVEGENNLLFSFANFENTKIVTGTLQIVLDSIAPNKPIFNSILNTDDNNPQLELNWQSSDSGSGLDYYIVEYKMTTDIEWQALLENTTSTEFIFPVEIGNSYEFRVKAVDKVDNESIWSNDGENNSILVDWSKEVVINEISYAPTYFGGCGGEWVELYNSQNTDLDLSDWSVEISDVSSSSIIALSGFVSSTSYKVIGVSNISDTGVKIILKNSLGKIIDQTDQSAGWFATPSFIHARSMERISASLSGNSKNNWRENNSLRFQLQNNCGQNYSSQGLDNNSYYYLSNNLSQDYIFFSTSTDNHVLTLTKDHNPYILDSRVILPANYTLVLEQGVVMVGLFGQSRLEVSGNLQFNGTAENPVYFTSARDKTVADWYLFGLPSRLSAGDPAPGDWSVIIIKGGGTMQADYTNFWYGGYTYRNGDCFVCYAQQVIRNEGGNLVLNYTNFDNMLVKSDYADGNDAYIWGGGNIEVNNSNFNKGYTAIMALGGSHISFAGDTFSNFTASGRSPLEIKAVVLDNWENNVFVDNTVNSTVLPVFNINEDYILTPSYNNVFFDGIFVSSTATLTILPGVDVNLSSSRWLKVEGNLQAIGTPDNHIRICPNGGCEGIWFQNSQDNIMSYVDVRNAGYQSSDSYPFRSGTNYTAPIWAINSQLNIDNSSVMDNRSPTGFCINSAGSDLDIRDSEFGWSSNMHGTHYNWVDGGIKLSGGSLYIDNVNFHFLNYGVYSNGASVTYDNMSIANFIDMYSMWPNKNWLPNSIFAF